MKALIPILFLLATVVFPAQGFLILERETGINSVLQLKNYPIAMKVCVHDDSNGIEFFENPAYYGSLVREAFSDWWGAIPENFIPPGYRKSDSASDLQVTMATVLSGRRGQSCPGIGGLPIDEGYNLHVYFARFLANSGNICAGAQVPEAAEYYPDLRKPALVITVVFPNGEAQTVDRIKGTLRHELGHWMGLKDTYSGLATPECVTGQPPAVMCRSDVLTGDDKNGAKCRFCLLQHHFNTVPDYPCAAFLESPTCKGPFLASATSGTEGGTGSSGGSTAPGSSEVPGTSTSTLSVSTGTVIKSSTKQTQVGDSGSCSTSLCGAWSNLANLAKVDGLYAKGIAPRLKTTNAVNLSGFNFAIASTSKVKGITVSVITRGNGNGLKFGNVQMMKAGLPVSANKGGVPLTNQMKLFTFGSGTDAWGTSWRPADINDPNFGLTLKFNNEDRYDASVEIERVEVEVLVEP